MKIITVKFEGAIASGKTKLMAILIDALSKHKIEGIIHRIEEKHTLVFEFQDNWTTFIEADK